MNGRLVEIKRLAVHDGPGIRTTLFLKGCSLACRWCHNPETISPAPEIGLISRKCVGCGKCAEACPVDAHVFRAGKHAFERELCVVCGRCVDACLPGALEYYGRELSVREAVTAVLEDRTFYATSGGGCTLSGGEPLLHAEFCAAVFRELQTEGIHCAVDTAGAVPWERFETVLPHTDLFLYDLKQVDDQAHRRSTGASNDQVLANLDRLSSCAVPIEIRMPLIPGINDTNPDLEAAGELLSQLNHLTGVRLLPYHALAGSKYETIGRPNTMPDVPPTSDGTLANAATALRRHGLTVLGDG